MHASCFTDLSQQIRWFAKFKRTDSVGQSLVGPGIWGYRVFFWDAFGSAEE